MGIVSAALVLLMVKEVYSYSITEPSSCSRVEWEDTILQKVVRAELTTKVYMEQLEKALETLKAQTEVFEETKNMIKVMSEDIRKEIDEKVNEMEQVVLGYEGRLTIPTVAFNVRDVLHTTPAEYEIIRFETVMSNIGMAYDEVTGLFTAPVDGAYFFGAQVCSSTSKYGRFEVAVDTKENIIIFIADYEHSTEYSSTSGTAVVYLKKGQRVWVQNRYSSTTLFDDTIGCWNQFTGALIHL